jgi:tetratricopeptide (TPR) repeat protein
MYRIVLGLLLFTTAAQLSADDVLPRAIALYEARQYEQATTLFQQAATQKASVATATFYLGRIALHQKKFERAEELLEKAVELQPKSADVHYWLGRAYGAQAMNANPIKQAYLARKTKSEFDAAVTLDPNHVDARWGRLEYYVIAPSFLGGGHDRARSEAAEILKRDTLLGHRAFGRIFHVEKDFAHEEQEYLAAQRAKPEAKDPYYWLGYFYQEHQQYKKAFDAFEALALRYPDEAGAYFQIGRTAAFSGLNLERAESCLRRFLQMTRKPDDPPAANAHYRLGQVYRFQKKFDRAKSEFLEALRLDPKLHDAAEELKKLS